jgi:hypothetical protein
METVSRQQRTATSGTYDDPFSPKDSFSFLKFDHQTDTPSETFLDANKPLIYLAIFFVLIIGGFLISQSPELRQKISSVMSFGKSPQQMASEINEMCKELDRMQAARQIDYFVMWNFTLKYGSMTIPMAMSPASSPDQASFRRLYEDACKEFNEIKRRAGGR